MSTSGTLPHTRCNSSHSSATRFANLSLVLSSSSCQDDERDIASVETADALKLADNIAVVASSQISPGAQINVLTNAADGSVHQQ